jgi:hypothetical protein
VLLADELVIVGMRADPEPHQSVGYLHGERAVTIANPGRLEAPDLLEVKHSQKLGEA